MRFTRKKSDDTGNHRHVRFFSGVLTGAMLLAMLSISGCSNAGGQTVGQPGGNQNANTNTQIPTEPSPPSPQQTPDSSAITSTPAPVNPSDTNNASNPSNPPETPGTSTTNRDTGDIGPEAAQDAAFSHAAVSAQDVTHLKCEWEMENNTAIYEIEFYLGQTEYEYEIDAATGAILKSEIDYHDHHD